MLSATDSPASREPGCQCSRSAALGTVTGVGLERPEVVEEDSREGEDIELSLLLATHRRWRPVTAKACRSNAEIFQVQDGWAWIGEGY